MVSFQLASLASFVLATAAVASPASSPRATTGQVKCAPYYVGRLQVFPPGDFEHAVPAGWLDGVDDSKGRKILALNGNGQPPSTVGFTFYKCSSTVMRSGEVGSKAATQIFGLVKPAHHPDKCLAASTTRKASGPTYIVSTPCATTDTVSAQLSQWWVLTVQGSPSDPNVPNRYLSLDGSPAKPSPLLNYGFYTVQALSKNLTVSTGAGGGAGDATCLELVWTPEYNGTAYTLGLGAPL